MSASLVGTVLSMVYISAILGGYIAEKLIGYYRAGMLGALFMVIGTFVLAISTTENSLYIGLSLISTSTGLIKSNMASFIGRFYDKSGLNDGHRDFGFNIFYIGINLGSFFALLIATSLKDKYGYSAPFYSSMIVSVIMLMALVVSFFFVRKHVIDLVLTKKIIVKIIALITVYIVILFFVFKVPYVASFSIVVALGAAIVILVMSAKSSSYKKVILASVFFAISILYWGLFFQIFISLLLFTEYAVSNTLLNSSQLLSAESLGVLIFGFIIGKLWLCLSNNGNEIKDIDKFNISFIIMAISFAVMAFSIILTPELSKVVIYGFIAAYLILSISELCLSAIGLSLITKIAPKGYVSLYMGIWLVTLGIGGKLGGYLASFIYIPENDVTLAKINMLNGLYLFIGISIFISFLLILIRKIINKNI